MRASRLERDPSRGGAPGGGGDLAQFHLAAGRQKNPLVPGKRPLVRPFLPRLQTMRLSLSFLVWLVHRGGRARRGGRSAAARTGLPAALGKAIVFGPNMQNFAAIAETFLRQDGAVQVGDAAGLEQALGELLEDKQRREVLGQNALKVVRE